MRRDLRLATFFVDRRTIASPAGLLALGAYAVPTALTLLVVGGTAAFFGWSAADVGGDTDLVITYRLLAVFASLLLLIPTVTLGASAAKLSARRHDRRLSTLSLLGASPRTIRRIAVFEPVVLSTLGVLVGLTGYIALTVPVGRIPFQGEPIGTTNLLLPLWAMAAIGGFMVLLSVGSASLGLRRVSVSPLGVRLRQDAAATGWVRLLAGVGVLGVVLLASSLVTGGDVAVGVFIAVAFGAVGIGLLVLNLIGAWFVQWSGRFVARRARRPEDLMAARVVCDQPRQTWRRVAGLGMTCFAAVFLGSGVALAQMSGSEGLDRAQQALANDLRTGVLLTLGIAFVLIGAAAVVDQRTDIADRADLFSALHAAGLDESAVRRLSVRTVTVPMASAIVFGVLTASAVSFPLIGLSLIFAPLSVAAWVSVCVIGTALLWASARWAARSVGSTLELSRAIT